VGGELWVALGWCAGILVASYFVAMALYRRKIS
jgi:ABC-2 type transport system permease protein